MATVQSSPVLCVEPILKDKMVPLHPPGIVLQILARSVPNVTVLFADVIFHDWNTPRFIAGQIIGFNFLREFLSFTARYRPLKKCVNLTAVNRIFNGLRFCYRSDSSEVTFVR
jgi:hypothetical protein